MTPPPPVRAPAAVIRVLALGDSYTVGESVAPDAAWPARLAATLRARGIAVSTLEVVARTGWTTDELAAGIDAAPPTGTYDLVTLLIGVNDQYRGEQIDAYQSKFRALLARAVAFAGNRPAHVIVVSIPDWSVTPFAAGRDRARIAAQIDGFNAANRAEAARTGARYVDVTPMSRRATDEPGLIASDGLHPSGRMYEHWLTLISAVAVAVLE